VRRTARGVYLSGLHVGPMRYRKNGHEYLGAAPAKKAVKRIKGRIREILHPGNQAPWDEGKEALNRVLRGWANYFSYGTRFMAYRADDNYVWERARYFLRRRHKVPREGRSAIPGTSSSGSWECSGSGALHLRRLRMPGCETRPRAGCGETARPVRRGGARNA
jgi:RNA-directed DNA polymerase